MKQSIVEEIEENEITYIVFLEYVFRGLWLTSVEGKNIKNYDKILSKLNLKSILPQFVAVVDLDIDLSASS